MSLPTKAKVVIVGGGIHGLSTAWKLSETYKNPNDKYETIPLNNHMS